MSEIPDDVMLDARDAYLRARALARGDTCIVGEMIWSPIASAILAERERCAKVAEAPDRRGREWVPGSLWDTLRSETASAIRRGTPHA